MLGKPSADALFVGRCVVIASDSVIVSNFVIAKPEGLKQSLDCFVALLLEMTAKVKVKN